MIKFLPLVRKGAFLLLLFMGMVSVQLASAQCTNTSQYPNPAPAAPTTVGQTVTNSTCNYYGEFSVITGFDSQYVYDVAIAASGYVTIYPTGSTTAAAFGPSPLNFAPPASGSYTVHWSADAACGTDFSCHVTSVTLTGFNTACTNPALAGAASSNPAMACIGQPVNLSLTGSSVGSGLTYQWQSSTDGVTYADIVGATSAGYSATQAVTTYYQCVVICTAGTPATSTPVQVDMNSFFNCYCNSNATQPGDTEIDAVAVGSLNNFSGCGVTGGGASVVGQYSDFSAMPAPNLIQGIGNTFTLTVGTCGSFGYNNMSKVYIDYNQNGDFTDVGEEVYVSPAFVNGAHVETFTLTVPLTTLTGNTGMRVVTQETTNGSNINPCGTYGYGETEDYLVNIVAPLNDDAGIAEFVSPTLPTCNFNDSVSVSLTNYGLDTLFSATINWEWNGVPQTPILWTGAIPPFSADTVVLGYVLLATGDDLLSYTTMPNGIVEDPSGSYNDSAAINNLQSGLMGSYTIGGTTPDYADFAAAVADLSLLGICGPVVFDVRDGSYPEQMVLPTLANSSAANTVTFRSENGDASLVTMTYAGTGAADNYVVRFSNSDHYIIEDLTLENTGTSFGKVIEFTGGNDFNRVENCDLIGAAVTSTNNNTSVIFSSGGDDNDNMFKGNMILGGSYGAYWYGTGITSPETGNSFMNNKFMDNYYYGARIQNNNGTVFSGNYLGGNSTYNFRYGVYFSNSNGAPQVSNNEIVGTISSGWVYGMYFLNSGGNSTTRALVSNNMVQVGATNTSSSTLYGIYMSGSGYINVYHNSVLASIGGGNSRALFATSGGEIQVINNVLANYTSGYAIYAGNNFSISNSDYNVLYSPTGNIGYYGGAQQTLADWQSSASFDANSVDYNPNFHSTMNLHVCNDSIGNQGMPMPTITMDIDGHPRSATTPDMGADEFNGVSGSFIGDDQVVCAGDSVMLWAGAPTDTILWSTGDSTSIIWVTTPGSYTVSVISSCGSGSDAVVVSASALNYAGYVAASDIVFCNGDSVLLNSTQTADTYTWTGGSTNDSLYVTAGGTYTLDIADACGTGSESITVTMDDVPTSSYTHTTNYVTGIFANTSVSGGNTTYAWDFGDGTTSSMSDPTHIFPGTGMFYVTLTVTNDCGTMMFGDTINLFVLGLEDVADFGSVDVYPNPSTGVYNVDLELIESMNIEIRVTNVMGQVVSTRAIQGANGTVSSQVDLSTQAAGVYYLDILSDNAKLANRILIKK